MDSNFPAPESLEIAKRLLLKMVKVVLFVLSAERIILSIGTHNDSSRLEHACHRSHNRHQHLRNIGLDRRLEGLEKMINLAKFLLCTFWIGKEKYPHNHERSYLELWVRVL